MASTSGPARAAGPDALNNPLVIDHLKKLLDGCNAAEDALRNCAELNTREILPTPRVVVLGEQSNGKSSVVSRIVGIRLPSAGGRLCTRTPLHIRSRMVNGEANRKADISVAEGDLHMATAGDVLTGKGWVLENGRYVKKLLPNSGAWPPPVEAVARAVLEGTEAVAGSGLTIVDKKLVLEWWSDSTPTLDIIDLPGLVVNPLEGQPATLPTDVENMVKANISDPATIILCVCNGVQDAANFTALKFARSVDPAMERTLVVITKLDLLGSLDERRRMLQAHLDGLRTFYPLETVLVKNSSTENEDFRAQTESEAAFIRDFEDIQAARSNQRLSFKLGIPALVTRLTSLLIKRIEGARPALKVKLDVHIRRLQSELADMDEAMTHEEAKSKTAALLRDFAEKLRDVLEGNDNKITLYKDLEESDQLLNNIAKVCRQFFEEVVTVPKYMNETEWDRLVEAYQRRSAQALPDEIDPVAKRYIFTEAFLKPLKEKLPAMIDMAYQKVMLTYDNIRQFVFRNHPVLEEEVKRFMEEKILLPQKKALHKYIEQTLKAQADVHTMSPVYEAAIAFFQKTFLEQPPELHEGGASEPKPPTFGGGALGVEQCLMPDITEAAMRIYSEAFAEGAEKLSATKYTVNYLRLRQEQWGILCYNVIVHNSLWDMLPRIIRLFLAREVIMDDDKVPSLAHSVLTGDSLLGDPQWLFDAMNDPDLERRRAMLRNELDALKAAQGRLDSVPACPFALPA